MKKILFGAIVAICLVFSACNSGKNKSPEGKDVPVKKTDTAKHATTPAEKEIKLVTATRSTIDAGVAASLKKIVDHYLEIKNALVSDNAGEAADGGKAMEKVISNLDKSLFTVQQKKLYDDLAEDLQENAEHIGKNEDNIKHQREHFARMSDDVYDLVMAFGVWGLYKDHCPMFNEGKGAIWLSENKEIKYPYFGKKMITCGSVEEVIR
jgi:hypothetical protein